MCSHRRPYDDNEREIEKVGVPSCGWRLGVLPDLVCEGGDDYPMVVEGWVTRSGGERWGEEDCFKEKWRWMDESMWLTWEEDGWKPGGWEKSITWLT